MEKVPGTAYALQLLAYAAVEGRSVAEMKRGRFGALLRSFRFERVRKLPRFLVTDVAPPTVLERCEL